MMPLWITTTLPARCGCAFCSDGRPCVAQRVWPMPGVPRERLLAQHGVEVVELADASGAPRCGGR